MMVWRVLFGGGKAICVQEMADEYFDLYIVVCDLYGSMGSIGSAFMWCHH